jgi:hypothetical protein
MKSIKFSVDSESGGINFIVERGNKKYHCYVSDVTLQDVDPTKRMNSVEELFNYHQSFLEEIANKIIDESCDDKIIITADIIRKIN